MIEFENIDYLLTDTERLAARIEDDILAVQIKAEQLLIDSMMAVAKNSTN